MKTIISIVFLLTASFVANAQYNKYYSPYDYAVAASEVDELYRLNNIQFDENAIRQNPKAWASYQNYLTADADYAKKNRTYSTIAWTGLGVSLVSLIPMYVSLGYDYDDPRGDAIMGLSIGLLCAGGVAAIIGWAGASVQLSKAKANKKEFIYYLKTTNNGVGIVTIF